MTNNVFSGMLNPTQSVSILLIVSELIPVLNVNVA